MTMKEFIKYLSQWEIRTIAYGYGTLPHDAYKFYERVHTCMQLLKPEEIDIIDYMVIHHHTVKETYKDRGYLATNYRKRNRALSKLLFLIEGRYNDKL